VPDIQAAFNRWTYGAGLLFRRDILKWASLQGFRVATVWPAPAVLPCTPGGCVPQNLLARLPDNVDFRSAAFTTEAIALHGFRLAQPQVGGRGYRAGAAWPAGGWHRPGGRLFVFGVDLSPRG
jgi:hypothetical protein